MTKPNISKRTLDNDKAQQTLDNDKAQHIKTDIRQRQSPTYMYQNGN